MDPNAKDITVFNVDKELATLREDFYSLFIKFMTQELKPIEFVESFLSSIDKLLDSYDLSIIHLDDVSKK